MPEINDADRAAIARVVLSSKLSTFRPWRGDSDHAPQAEFLKAAATHRTRIMRAGNRSGKTAILVVDCLLQFLGFHPFAAPRERPWRGWLVALDWSWGVGQVLWPEMQKWLPPADFNRLIRSVVWYRFKEPSIPSTLVAWDGSQLDLKSAEAGRKKFQGSDLDYAGVDEEAPGSIINEIRARLVRRAGHLAVAATPVEGEAWLERIENEATTTVIRASMSDAASAGLLDVQAVGDYLAGLTPTERAIRDKGEFATATGLVYPQLTDENSVYYLRISACGKQLLDHRGVAIYPYPLPHAWRRWGGVDFGYENPSCFLGAAQDPSGTLIVYACLHVKRTRVAVWGQQLVDRWIHAHENWQKVFADHDSEDRAELEYQGLVTAPAEKSIKLGIRQVERRLALAKGTGRPGIYFVYPECKPLVMEARKYRWPDEDKDSIAIVNKDLPIDRFNHVQDALRYLTVGVDGLGPRLQVVDNLEDLVAFGGPRTSRDF